MASGHATVAFAVSSVLAERIDNIYASIALYGLFVFIQTVRHRDYFLPEGAGPEAHAEPPGDRASARSVPRTTTAASCPSRSSVSQSAGATSLRPATHCMRPLPSRRTTNCTLPLERLWVIQPRTSTVPPTCEAASRMRIQETSEELEVTATPRRGRGVGAGAGGDPGRGRETREVRAGPRR